MVDISVVVPVYNGEKTIKSTIESLLSQKTGKSYEIIVVDDGSTDNTCSIIKNYPIKIITQKNAGPSAARNSGWKAASGTIIAFTDSDCVPVSNWLEEMIMPFKDISVGGVAGTYKTENTESILAIYIGEDIRFRHKNIGTEIDATGTFSAAFRKKLLEQTGGFDQTYQMATAEDFDLCFAIRKTGHKIIYQPGAIVGHYHEEKFFNFLKQQFRHAVWRVYLYNKYKNMAKGDKYTPLSTLIQVPISLLFLLSLLLSFFIKNFFIFSLICLFILIALAIPFMNYEIKRKPLISIMGVFMQLIRNIVWTFGFVFGLINLVMIKHKLKQVRSDATRVG